MLKITVLSKVFVTNKLLVANKFGDIKDSDELIKKFVKPKTKKLFKSQKLSKLK